MILATRWRLVVALLLWLAQPVDATGQVGVTASGTFPIDSQVILVLPSYLDLTGKSVTITSDSNM